MLKIDKGLFAGTEIPETQLVTLSDENNQPVIKADGSLIQYWPAMYRTPIFLEKFSPLDGWGIEITSTESPFQFQSKYPTRDGSIVIQPTLYLTAKLVKDGHVIASATSLATIEGPKSFEAAESILRGRLYDALGLSYPRHQEIKEPDPDASEPVLSVVPASESEKPESAPKSEEKPKLTPVKSQKSPIERNLLAQITLQCNQRGMAIPEFADNKEASSFLKDLLLRKQA